MTPLWHDISFFMHVKSILCVYLSFFSFWIVTIHFVNLVWWDTLTYWNSCNLNKIVSLFIKAPFIGWALYAVYLKKLLSLYIYIFTLLRLFFRFLHIFLYIVVKMLPRLPIALEAKLIFIPFWVGATSWQSHSFLTKCNTLCRIYKCKHFFLLPYKILFCFLCHRSCITNNIQEQLFLHWVGLGFLSLLL